MRSVQRLLAFLGRNRTIFIVALIFLTYTLLSFGFYQARTLNGEINNHILAADMFGVPADLKERGIKTLYHGPVESGWDGQFYYYMSNDILGLKDTASHIDTPSYRYQRVGLSLYAAIVAKILGRDWVSPTIYFLSYLLLILAATLAGAHLFSRLGIHPAFILLWSLSAGTQVTLFNALPDAAADSFLILALAAVYAKRYALSVIPFAFAALSREVYVLFPSFILLFHCINLVSEIKGSREWGLRAVVSRFLQWRHYYLLALPGLVAVIWHVYVTQHFGAPPVTGAGIVLGYPLAAWTDYFLSGIKGNHLFVGPGLPAYAEAGSLLLFLTMLAAALWISIYIYIKRYQSVSPEIRGLVLTALCFIFLYASFGPVVIKHYTGYLKAAAVFFFLIPLLLIATDAIRKKQVFVYLLLVIAFSFPAYYSMKVRILPFSGVNDDQYTKMSTVTKTQRIECFDRYEAKIKVKGIEVVKRNFLQHFFGAGDKVVINLELKNTGQYPFVSSQNFGSVFMSYHWIDETGKVITDGVRSAIPGILRPGQSAEISVVSNLPDVHGDRLLKLSPVQEGCAWFYLSNPNISQGLKFHLRQ